MNRPTRILPLIAGLFGITVLLGCTSEIAAPSEPSFIELDGKPAVVVTFCESQPHAIASGWIGPMGGTLKVGTHTLRVPARAVSTPTWITMEAPSSPINSVVLGPSGLTFNRNYPAHLIMSYANCPVEPGSEQRIAHIDDRLQVIGTPRSWTDPTTLTVDAELPRVLRDRSTYAVVY